MNQIILDLIILIKYNNVFKENLRDIFY